MEFDIPISKCSLSVPSVVFGLPNLNLRRSPIGYFDMGGSKKLGRNTSVIYKIIDEYMLNKIL